MVPFAENAGEILSNPEFELEVRAVFPVPSEFIIQILLDDVAAPFAAPDKAIFEAKAIFEPSGENTGVPIASSDGFEFCVRSV